MTTFFCFWFVISQFAILCQPKNLHLTEHSKFQEKIGSDFEVSESRYSQRKNQQSGKWDHLRKNPHPLEIFEAPHYKAEDYWHDQHKKSSFGNRKSFYEDVNYFGEGKRTTSSGFYSYVTPLFKDGHISPDSERYQFKHDSPTFLQPFGFKPTAANYIPPSKPIRASVIKLETITRSPNLFPTFHYDSSAQYFPHLESILNQVLIENSKKKHHHDLSFHYQSESSPRLEPIPINLSILPKPLEFPPTTLRPLTTRLKTISIDNRNIFKAATNYNKNQNRSEYKYPKSVQDQLPPLISDSEKIPYVEETTTADSSKILLPTIKYDNNENFRINLGEKIDVRSFGNWAPGFEKEKATNFESTTSREFTQKLNDEAFSNQNKTSVELISNLTVEGLKKGKSENANINNYVNYFNSKNVINYETDKQENSTLVYSGKVLMITNASNIFTGAVNLNDELSLDAKILKDTHWDGITTTERTGRKLGFDEKTKSKVTENNIDSNPKQKFNYDRDTREKAQLETSKENDTASLIPETNFTESTDVDINSTTTEIPTTTEYLTSKISETTITLTTMTEKNQENSTTTQEPEPRTINQSTKEPVLEAVIEIETTTVKEKLTINIPPKRKYNRRAKIVNFTPYPTATELHKKINRNNFPKRQKPNITLSFGNKDLIKSRDNHLKDEVMKFSDEDVSKRLRKVGKRRHGVKRTRFITTESSV